MLLLATAGRSATAGQVVHGVAAFTEARLRGTLRRARGAWLRELLTLWMMDTVNILSTCLSSPASLPLPPSAEALVRRAGPVCRMVDRISHALSPTGEPQAVWDLALAEAAAVVR